jgi:hypothetical protein
MTISRFETSLDHIAGILCRAMLQKIHKMRPIKILELLKISSVPGCVDGASRILTRN